YGRALEIIRDSVACAACFLVDRSRRRMLLLASVAAAFVLQIGRWIEPSPLLTDHTAILLQPNLPVGDTENWTQDHFRTELQNFVSLSLNPLPPVQQPDLIIWPESPAPFQTNDPFFRDTVGNLARQSNAWVVVGAIGIDNPRSAYNSAALISLTGRWDGRYDKIHLVPFGEYVPFQSVFSFASGLTQAVGTFNKGTSRTPLAAGDTKLGIFICYESIFPDEVRRLVAQGARVLVNISNDGWYGDSGAWAQHLNQARMRAVENRRWLLRDTNTGLTSAIDPYGRVTVRLERKTRAVLVAAYSLTEVTTFYSRHGDWFAYLCAIISTGALVVRFAFHPKTES